MLIIQRFRLREVKFAGLRFKDLVHVENVGVVVRERILVRILQRGLRWSGFQNM